MAYEPFPFHAGHHVLDTSLNSVPHACMQLLRTRREHVGLRARGPYKYIVRLPNLFRCFPFSWYVLRSCSVDWPGQVPINVKCTASR